MRILGSCAVAAAIAMFGVAQAHAACRDDLIRADQDFSATRTALQAAANAAAPVKCAAYRRHVASLTQVGKVFARCDGSAEKAKNAAQTNAALADFRKQMNETCKK